jgi:hypothetical protein
VAEVPVLRSLGYEVWTQKQAPPGTNKHVGANDFRSGNTDYSFDEPLTIPERVVNELNQFNFYDQELKPNICRYLNNFFCTIVTDCVGTGKLAGLLRQFSGRIVLRIFGREHPLGYMDLFWYNSDLGALSAVREAYSRFWFGAAYSQVISHEHPFLAKRAVHLPVPLTSEILAQYERRRCANPTSSSRRVLFVCPSINDKVYYREIYDRFKARFGSLPHIIAGHQRLTVDDRCVLGFLPDADYTLLFTTSRAMYYHSREPRHLHYHPLEAIAYGLPVVYLTGGLLDYYDKRCRSGACETEEEAFVKLKRLLDGDEEFAEKIRVGQQGILDAFRPEAARAAWQGWFAAFEENTEGQAPADSLWPNVPPIPTAEDLVKYPALHPRVWQPDRPTLVRRLVNVGISKVRKVVSRLAKLSNSQGCPVVCIVARLQRINSHSSGELNDSSGRRAKHLGLDPDPLARRRFAASNTTNPSSRRLPRSGWYPRGDECDCRR